MNNVEDIKNSIPDFAKDIRLNFSSIIMNSVYEDDDHLDLHRSGALLTGVCKP